MTTIVVHGTKGIDGGPAGTWWHASNAPGGFIHALAGAMTDQTGDHDVWCVAGQPVSRVADLTQRWGHWAGPKGARPLQNGHFAWSGANMSIARTAGADDLAHYLTVLSSLTGEPLRIVAFSHGANVVKAASRSRALGTRVRIERAVFLACPHFVARAPGGDVLAYRLDPERFGAILNLYTNWDTVQVSLSDAITGPASARWMTWVPPEACTQDPDGDAQAVYESLALPAADHMTGMAAHSALRGPIAARVAGYWLSGIASADIAGACGGALPILEPPRAQTA